MSSDSPQIQAIKERYKASFPEKMEVVRSLSEAIEASSNLTPLREELHKLAGSLGMYGYGDIAAVCRVAMKNIDDQQNAELSNTVNKLIGLLEQHA